MSDTNAEKENILNLLPERVKNIKRNDVTLAFPAVLGKRKDWENVPYYKPDVKNIEIGNLVKWVGEDFVRKSLGQRLTLIAQEAMWRATHQLSGKKIKNAKGEEEDEYIDKPFDSETFDKALTELRQASGKTKSELNDDLNDLLEELASASDAMEAAEKTGDPAKLMACMKEWTAVTREINSVQAALKARSRPRDDKE